MATVVQSRGETFSLAEFVDRWIYVFMAGMMVAVVLLGFVPESFQIVAAINSGERPMPPIILHVHAVLMGSWMMLLLAQTVLMATNRRKYHMTLGLAGLVVMPAMILVGPIVMPTMVNQLVYAPMQTASPDALPAMRAAFDSDMNIVAAQLRIALIFGIFVTIALMLRRKDPETHKRLMILATLVAVQAGFDRITWLPGSDQNALWMDVFVLVAAAPMFLWDLYRLKRVQRAYVWWFAAYVPMAVAVNLVWGKSWWIRAAAHMMGFDHIPAA